MYTVTSPGTLTIVATGAQGGQGMAQSAGGNGGQITGTITITNPPQTFLIVVGGQGGDGQLSGVTQTGGAGGKGQITGGDGGSSSEEGLAGGGGGAASTITLNSSLIMVAQGEVEEDPMVRSLPAEWGVESREVQERLRHLPLVWEKWEEAAEQMEVVD